MKQFIYPKPSSTLHNHFILSLLSRLGVFIGLVLYWASTWSSPGTILELSRIGNSARDIALVPPFAYVAGDGFTTIDFSDPMQPAITANQGFNNGLGGSVAISGSVAFVGLPGQPVSIYDLSNPAAPAEIDRLSNVGGQVKLEVADDLLFAATSQREIHLFDISDPINPSPLSRIFLGNEVEDMAVAGDHLIAAAGFQGLVMIDISNPGAPVQGPNVNFGGEAEAVTIVGSLAYVAFGSGGLRILDISDPANPQSLGQITSGSRTLDVAVQGTLAYLIEQPGRLRIVDVSDPATPQMVDSFFPDDSPAALAVTENLIFLGYSSRGTEILLHEKEALPATPDKFTTGSLSVTIEPLEAVIDGARWSVPGRPNRPSDFRESNLPAGDHTVRFNDLLGWREPDLFSTIVAGGGEARITATFFRVPAFYFKSVPDQEARHGATLEFFIHTDDPSDPQNPGPGAALQVTADPLPAGNLTFDRNTGLLRYIPDEQDRLPFTLQLAAGGQNAETMITPQPNLVPEANVIAFNGALPDEESRDFINITETINPPEEFNSSIDPVPTLNVDISGKTLIFEQGHPAALLESYDDRSNIKNMNLFAERIIIRSPLRLPQTRVAIHARELRFEGDGSIHTTPRPQFRTQPGRVYADGASSGLTGHAGLPGGNIDAFIETFHADQGGGPRFVLRGGRGGPAGEGRDGMENEDRYVTEKLDANGNPVVDEDGKPVFEAAYPVDSAAWRDLMDARGVEVCDIEFLGSISGSEFPTIITMETLFSIDNNPPLSVLCGEETLPRGENAVPSGRPGPGGPGGTLHSTLNLTAYADFTGGNAGPKGNDYLGGTLDGPFAYQRKEVFDGKLRTGYQFITPQRGLPAAAPEASQPNGPSGRNTLTSNADAWFHSFYLRGILEFAKDAYLNGQVAAARALLVEYRDIIRAVLDEPEDPDSLSEEAFAEFVNINQILLEIDTLVHRIDSNLDYFGNPAGFVPMLSFEANLQAFRNEVAQSIPILYHAYFLTHAANELRHTTEAASTTRDKLVGELAALEATFNEAQLAIPRLTSIADDLNLKIFLTIDDLRDLERELEERAQQNLEDKAKLPLWKKALGSLAVASHLVPVGQPVVGKIGTGLGLLGQVDPGDPFGSAAAVAPKAIDAFSKKNITVCFKSDSVTNETKKAKVKRLTECGKVLGDELKQLADLFKSSKVEKSALEAELARIKALDPAFKEVTEKLAELNRQKEQFGLELETAIQAVASLTGEIGQNLAATHDIERNLAGNLAVLDHNTLLHVKSMERRAKDRLLQQQYFAALAFQYRTLKPFGGSLQLDSLLEPFQDLVDASNGPGLPAAQIDLFKSIYQDGIQDIVQSTFNNFDAPDRAQSIQFELNARELQELNENGRTIINLKDRLQFGDTDQNIRLNDISTTQMQVTPAGGDIGTLATLGIKYTHLGVSRLTSQGQTFLFRHYQTEEVNPIFWQTSYDGLDDTFSNSVLSPAEQSLLASLLGPSVSTENLLLFSRPAAFAEIEITKDILTDNRIDLVLNQLRMRVSYEFETEGVARPELDVRTLGGLQPVIAVSQPDINGRRDGVGAFSRTYQPFTQVTLEAPTIFGGVTFDRWIVNGIEQPAGQTTVAIALEEGDELAEARYETGAVTGEPPRFLVQPGSQVLPIGSTLSLQAVVAGDVPLVLRWHKDGQPLEDGGRVAGAGTAELVITNLQIEDSGAYVLTASNVAGSANSEAGIVAVTSAALTTLDAGPDNVGFRFETMPGLLYTIERKIQLNDPSWTPIESRVGTGEPMQFTRPTITTNRTAFFRLRIDVDRQ